MEKIWHHWKQGWKFQLAMLLFNICLGVLLVPIALLFNLDKQSYYAVAIPIYILIMVPIGGYLSWLLRPKAFSLQSNVQENA